MRDKKYLLSVNPEESNFSSFTLISNSGIQYLKYKMKLYPESRIISPIGFYEHKEGNETEGDVILELAYYLSDYDIWVPKKELIENGYLYSDGTIDQHININVLTKLDTDKNLIVINKIKYFLDKYEKKWLPVPYFMKLSENNIANYPTAWTRMYFKLIEEESNEKGRNPYYTYQVILAFDTTTRMQPDEENILYPEFFNDDKAKDFFFPENEALILEFVSSFSGWVKDYLKFEYINYYRKEHNDREPEDLFPRMKYLAEYIYFIKYLSSAKLIPKIILYNDKSFETINVEMAIDIGHSRTSVILFELPQKATNAFIKVEKLRLQDLSYPEKEYESPFDMQIVFSKTGMKFGEIFISNANVFTYPSLIRMGEEAKLLIRNYTTEEDEIRSDFRSYSSSPKKYLWDNRPSLIPWRFIETKEDVYFEGISEHIDENGKFVEEPDITQAQEFFSRKALMTLVFQEILLQAQRFINSYEFRFRHGDEHRLRRISNIVITAPTTLLKEEQIALRESAQEAVKIINNYYQLYSGKDPIEYEQSNYLKINVIPDLKTISQEPDMRQDWLYDEATCSQIAFLYGEISQRYLNNINIFFDIYGKNTSEGKKITVATLDIGAGTSDLMVAEYVNEKISGAAVLNPYPIFYESFNIAGDDLAYEIVREIVIEGEIEDEREKGAKGVIKNYAKNLGISNIEDKIQNFFGTDSNLQSYQQRVFRRDFMVQIALPIAYKYLEHAANDEEDKWITFEEMFQNNLPNDILIDYINKHFDSSGGFDFRAIKWKLSKYVVDKIIENNFEDLIKLISIILNAYDVDFLVLSGRTTNINTFNNLFIKYFPVSPDRIIQLSNYRIGRWYPFADDSGYLKDTKTVVAVGAIISILAGKLSKFTNFTLNTKYLRENIKSTVNFIGIYDKSKNSLSHVFNNLSNIKIISVPNLFGYKQLKSMAYPAKPFYIFDIDEHKIRQNLLQESPLYEEMPALLEEELNKKKSIYKNKLPYYVDIAKERDSLKIEYIESAEGYPLSKKDFSFRLQTIPDSLGTWIDTGEFILSITIK